MKNNETLTGLKISNVLYGYNILKEAPGNFHLFKEIEHTWIALGFRNIHEFLWLSMSSSRNNSNSALVLKKISGGISFLQSKTADVNMFLNFSTTIYSSF